MSLGHISCKSVEEIATAEKINIKKCELSYFDAAPQILRAKGKIHSPVSLPQLLMLAVAKRTDHSFIRGLDLQFSTAKLHIRLL